MSESPSSTLRVGWVTWLDAESVWWDSGRGSMGSRYRSLDGVPVATGNPWRAPGRALTRWCLRLARTSLKVCGGWV